MTPSQLDTALPYFPVEIRPMKKLASILVTAFALAGCASTPAFAPSCCTDQPKACGCTNRDGLMTECMHDADGKPCCSKESCRCKEITKR